MKITHPILALSVLILSVTGCTPTSEEAPSNSETVATNPLPKPSDVVTNLQALSDFVDYAIFNRWDYATVTLQDYPIDDLDVELARVYWTAQLVDIDPMISGRLFGDRLTVYFDYRPERVLLTASESPAYLHGRDVTYVPFSSSRNENFSDFPYKDYAHAVDVTTSDQLWYCLDQGFRPLPSPGSKAEAYLAQCEGILREIVDDSMSEEEKVRAIYDWESFAISYDFEAATLSTTDAIAATYDAFYLEGVLDNHIGVCDAYAKLFTLLVNMEGIPCKRVLGPSIQDYQSPVIGSVGHAWNLVKIGDLWYTIDPTGGNAIFRSDGVGVASHFYYLTSEEKHLDHYAGGYRRYGYPEINPVVEFDYFSQTHFDPLREVTEANDLVMENMTEFIDFLSYAHDLPTNENYPSLSAEVTISFEVGAVIDDELEAALVASGWGTSWNGTYRHFIDDGRLLIFLR